MGVNAPLLQDDASTSERTMGTPAASILDIPLDPPLGRPTLSKATLEWINVTYTLKAKSSKTNKEVLKGVSGQMRTGELLAVLGGSGAGKTTLMNILCGRFTEGLLKGEILLNGVPRPPNWPRYYGFVEQHDTFYGELTVQETLTYSAKFLLKGASDKVRRTRVQEVMEQLGLLSCRDHQVGNPLKLIPSISTGEKKRLSIAIQLIAGPNVIFFDEPTSGLDSFNALNTIEYIHSLKSSRMLMVSIHQPRENILALFDNIILLSLGQVIFAGSLSQAVEHFAAVGHPVPSAGVNPADYFLDLVTPDSRNEENRTRSSATIAKLHMEWRARMEPLSYARALARSAQSEKQEEFVLNEKFALSLLGEYMTLNVISWKLTSRDKLLLIAQAIISLTIVFLCSLIFWRVDKSGFDGVISLMGFLWIYQLSNGVPTVFTAIANTGTLKHVLVRERAASMYRSLSLYLARITNLALFHWAYLLVEGLILWGTVGLQNPHLFILGMFACNMFWVCLGVAFACVAPDLIISRALGVLAVFSCSTFSGYYPSANKLIPWIKYIDPMHYALCQLGQSEFGSEFPPALSLQGLVFTPNAGLCTFTSYWANFGMLFGFISISVVLGVVAMHSGTRVKLRLK
ncbi:P-loop containing nucleoside triphosphate hydrolase protein [Gonapodya prolifera JEL478]|uniref:p-loop containing nucleoside triphosphate hydrolase protein n=1 Tax=Gonapodya prolifera (strain JEL478) TaxID=1344416 RepID=A0A139AXU6_GONPJ|nr:P-loop containing nucleoside triphosphate hydrolase protein [Gonapodya prolifera JEL478]|eukprot:KXS21539.1 P-loop containing nucleoside triphosphate hydrolase protein [Gonapodya prolifera JEL478]